MNQEDIDHKQLIDALFSDGLATAARKLDFLQGEKVWNSPSEFRVAFRAELQETKRRYWDRMSPATQLLFSKVAGQ